ncbi:MAG: hypothetical protein NZM37_05560, partial [Sandaracinaceae bacterium]|nr:hypothetical protein [Sandaracinaceae bacterium]
ATPDNSFRNDFGDALAGTTFDRIAFFTRPLNIINTLAGTHIAEYKGPDGLPTTPFVLGLAYDWLVEDSRGYNNPSTSTVPPRSNIPFAFLAGSEYPGVRPSGTQGQDDVFQSSLIFAWVDPEFNSRVSARDELIAALVLVYRGQAHTSSDIWIGDAFYRLRWSAFGRRMPLIYSEGELYTIQGTSNGVPLTGDYCDDPTAQSCTVPFGRTATRIGANIWGGAARLGLEDPIWTALVESGFSTGQAGLSLLGQKVFTQRPNNPNYLVGLLLYPVVLNVRTAMAYEIYSPSVWSQGGVWNSIYILPQLRFRPLGPMGGLELIGQFLLAFADQLNEPLNIQAGGSTGKCSSSISPECLLGWELDLALKVSWGPKDEMRWSNEFGVMGVGDALGAIDSQRDQRWGRLTQPLLWTLQSRIAFLF